MFIFRKKIVLIILFLIVIIFFVLINFVFAQNFGMEYASTLGLSTQGLRTILVNLIKTALGFLGILAVIVILAGGFQWMLSGGNEEKIARARGMIIAGIIGLVIILTSFSIVKFVIDAVA